jgi:hypothetical protein
MHHPVQMKPADSEKRNGEQNTGKCCIYITIIPLNILYQKINVNPIFLEWICPPLCLEKSSQSLRDFKKIKAGQIQDTNLLG